MRIAQFEDSDGPCVGVELKGQWINYSRALPLYFLLERGTVVHSPATVMELLSGGRFDVAEIRRVLAFAGSSSMQRQLVVKERADLRAPIQRPGKIIALGLNYALHAKEGKMQVPKEPIIFAKASSSVIGPGETVRIPRGLGRMDHEVELAVVVGKVATRVKRKDAYRYIAGYCICNDVTARDVQSKDIEQRHPWFRSKSFDTFTPLGPWIVTSDELRLPLHLDLECRVNGTVRQKANTRDLVFSVPEVIEFVTRYITLEPGDIVSTGTPEGIGPIRHGDVVSCRIRGIGELENPVKYR